VRFRAGPHRAASLPPEILDFHQSSGHLSRRGDRLAHHGLSSFKPPSRFHPADAEFPVRLVAHPAAGFNAAGKCAFPQKPMRGPFEKRCHSLDQEFGKAKRLTLSTHAPRQVQKIIAVGVAIANYKIPAFSHADSHRVCGRNRLPCCPACVWTWPWPESHR
jgi:hypothetical protein